MKHSSSRSNNSAAAQPAPSTAGSEASCAPWPPVEKAHATAPSDTCDEAPFICPLETTKLPHELSVAGSPSPSSASLSLEQQSDTNTQLPSVLDAPDCPEKAELITQVRARAENLFASRKFLCAEAVVVTLNEAFDGPLTHDEAVHLGSPFCVGMGGAGCTCGALTGALAITGMFIGHPTPDAGARHARSQAKSLHDEFRATFGSTCCRVLTRPVKNSKRDHFAQCREFTGFAAAMAATRILEKQRTPNERFLAARNTRIGTLWHKLKTLLVR